MRQDPPEPFLGSKGRKEHGQDRLSGSRGNLDVAGGAEAVWNELDQLLKHAQGMKMGLKELTVTHIFLLWAKDLISLADPAALGGRARERTCSMKPVIGPRPSSGRPTLGMQDAPTVS